MSFLKGILIIIVKKACQNNTFPTINECQDWKLLGIVDFMAEIVVYNALLWA